MPLPCASSPGKSCAVDFAPTQATGVVLHSHNIGTQSASDHQSIYHLHGVMQTPLMLVVVLPSLTTHAQAGCRAGTVRQLTTR